MYYRPIVASRDTIFGDTLHINVAIVLPSKRDPNNLIDIELL